MKKWEQETIRKQLKDESQCLKDLEKAYKQAKKDCQEQLRRLNSRKDMQNLQSIIYQKKYQTALLKQIDGVLNDLQTHTYKTANEFFQGSYQNGYIGSMYELQKEGIPFTIPVDPKKMVTAIQTDSKISKDYYLGKGLSVQNIRTLKKQIALEATRGIASGQGWLEVAESLAVQKCFQISLSDSMRICRTEGNRINQQARLDAGDEAVQNGCDILKQWDATLDGVTRPAHREADGQIREWGEDFIVMGEKLPAPSVGGSASNVCNCRCQLLKRPRWVLDDEELQVLKDRAGFYGLDKTKNFEEYKEKFLKLPPVPVQVQVVQAVNDVKDTTKKLQGVMKQDDYDEYIALVSNNPDISALYQKADDIGWVKYKSGSGCCWGKRGLEFGYPNDTYVKEGMSKFQTVAHEYGHFFDTLIEGQDLDDITFDEYSGLWKNIVKNFNKQVASASDQFLSAMRKDRENIKDNLDDVKKYCREHLQTSVGVQDAIDGFGFGRVWWGHGDRYYNRFYNDWVDPKWGKEHKKEVKEYYKGLGFDVSNQAKVKKITRDYETSSELWANITSAVTCGGEELETFKKYFPETLDTYLKIIKKLV